MNESPVVAALELDEAALEETLAWARTRCHDLLRTLQDRELLALLTPPTADASTPEPMHERPEPVPPAAAAPPPPPRPRPPRPPDPTPERSASIPELQRVTPKRGGPAQAHPWMMKPPSMGPTQVHPRATAPRPSTESSAKRDPSPARSVLELGTLVEPETDAEDLLDATELDEVELPDADWGPPRDPDAPDPDAPVPRRSSDHRSFYDAAHQSAPARSASGSDRRQAPRYSLTEPAVIEIRNWSELVTLYVRDISAGGLFVGTTAPPAAGVEVTVQLMLPDEAGALDFDGRVVRVVTPDQAAASGKVPGFGIQFLGLTPERRRALERLIEQAERTANSPDAETPRLSTLGLSGKPGPVGGLRLTLSEAERQQMQQLRAELEAMNDRGDLEVLGLSEPGTFEQLRTAFERLAQRWHPGVTHRDAPPEVRALAIEIFLRIERAYRRLCDAPQPAPPRGPEPVAASASTPAPVPTPPEYAADGPRPETVIGPAPTAPPRPRARAPRRDAPPPSASQARRMVGDLVDRGEKLTRQLKRRGYKALPEDVRQEMVDDALDLISAKRYREASRLLAKVIRDRPELRLRVLLRVINARQAVMDRDYARAQNSYQAVLQLDPNNALAKRELLLLSGLTQG